MPVVPFIPLISAGVGAAGAIASSRSANRGQQQAAQASQQASDAAIAEQRRQYDLARSDQQPWLTTGSSALRTLAGLYGLDGANNTPAQPTTPQVPQAPQTSGFGTVGRNGQPANFDPSNPNLQRDLINNGFNTAMSAPMVQEPMATVNEGYTPQTNPGPGGGINPNQAPFFASPDYQFRLDEAMRGLTARNAALGIQDSGAAQRSALTLAGNQASGEFNNYANRLASLAGVGQSAANQNAATGQNFAGAYGGILQNNAQNLASSYQNQGQTNANLYAGLAGSVSPVLNWLGNRYG